LAEPLRRAGARLGGLDGAIARRRVGDEAAEQLVRRLRHRLDGAVEGGLVRLGRPIEAAQLAHELQRRGADLLIGGGRLEIMQGPDIAAHGASLIAIMPATLAQEGRPDQAAGPSPDLDSAGCKRVYREAVARERFVSRRAPRRCWTSCIQRFARYVTPA
jgi:hypothetical protein